MDQRTKKSRICIESVKNKYTGYFKTTEEEPVAELLIVVVYDITRPAFMKFYGKRAPKFRSLVYYLPERRFNNE